jgi:hypothetical protein
VGGDRRTMVAQPKGEGESADGMTGAGEGHKGHKGHCGVCRIGSERRSCHALLLGWVTDILRQGLVEQGSCSVDTQSKPLPQHQRHVNTSVHP